MNRLFPAFSTALVGLLPLPTAGLEVSIDASVKYQTVEGFGASINGWNSRTIPIYEDPAYLDFVVHELGLSMFRMQLWPRVRPTEVTDWEDISYADFVFDGGAERAQVNLDFAKEIRARNPEVRIIGTSWSPPAWMKENNSINGTQAGFLLDPNRTFDLDNVLRNDRLQHFAKYLVEFQKLLLSHDVGLYALGVQNEPMFTQWYESALVSGPEYAAMVKAVGEQFAREGMERPLLFGPEDMTLASYNPDGETVDDTRHNAYVEALTAPEVAPYFDVWATHGYSDGVQDGDKFDAGRYWESVKSFDRPFWITEGGTGKHEWPAPLVDGMAAMQHHALVDGNVGAFVCWQISDTEANTHGVMHMKAPTKKTYAAMHYWRFIRPGAQRIDASPSDNLFRISAFQHPDSGQVTIVVINPTRYRLPLEVDLAGLPEVKTFQPYRTNSGDDNCARLPRRMVRADRFEDEVPGFTITTYVATREGWELDETLGEIYRYPGQWSWHQAFGYAQVGALPWIYRLDSGWAYLANGTYADGMLYYDLDGGWFYTAEATGGWAYSYRSQSWVRPS
jgi:O-glycosyl hydrolase